MYTYLPLILALITQETLVSHIAIFQALENGVLWYQIHFLWLVVTIFDLLLPYWFGKVVLKYVKNKRFLNIVNSSKIKFSLSNSSNKYLILFILGIFNFVYINTFLLAYSKIEVKKAMI